MRRESPRAPTMALIVPELPSANRVRGSFFGSSSRNASAAKLRMTASRSRETLPEEPKISVSRTAPSATL